MANLLLPPTLTLHRHRLRNLPERIYFDYWAQECERCPGLNGGYGLLEHILTPEDEEVWRTTLSQRDVLVATSTIQWLGTNCGLSFVHECERRIREEKAVREAFHTHYMMGHSQEGWQHYINQTPLYVAAQSLAADWVPVDARGSTMAQRTLAGQIIELACAHLRGDVHARLAGLPDYHKPARCVDLGERHPDLVKK